MARKSVPFLRVSLGLLFAAAFVSAQDFQRTYRLAENSRVSIKNVAGDILVKGYEGSEIQVTAFKQGKDKERLTIEDFSTDSKLDIRVNYPQECNCEASIRFEVQVPSAIYYHYDPLSTVAGDLKVDSVRGMVRLDNISGLIKLRNITGTLFASSFSGDIVVERAAETPGRGNGRWRRGYQRLLPGGFPQGSILAKSVSGNVKVMMTRLDDASTSQMEFSSVSGSVEIMMPEGLGAQVLMATMVGRLETEFPLVVSKDPLGVGISARGQVGDGSRQLTITSTAGNVALRKNQ